MKIWVPVACVYVAILCADTVGAVSSTVVDVPSGAHTQRFLYVHPDAPVANIVHLPGGSGVLYIQADGTMGAVNEVVCGPVVRLRQNFADLGFAVALVDANSVGDIRQFDDVQAVIHYMQARDNVPTWIIGGSSSTEAALTIATTLPGDSPVGIVAFSPNAFTKAQAALVTRPTAIVYDPMDSSQHASTLYSYLTSATIKTQIALNGDGSGCGYHLFGGQEAQFVAAVTGFITQHNGALGSSPTVLVVEYHHTAFDHYFITPVPAEIALLDAKAPPFQDWSRTGFSFNAYANSTAPVSSVAICRFFNSSFAPKSSHFYAAHGFGCEDTIRLFPDWGLEDDKLVNTMLPDASGACPAGTIPLYRLYNRGMGGAPNHRFVTSLVERQNMLDKGFVAEGSGIGVGMCVPGI